jgi:cell division protein FtsI (penicillin-binding protein 3)
VSQENTPLKFGILSKGTFASIQKLTKKFSKTLFPHGMELSTNYRARGFVIFFGMTAGFVLILSRFAYLSVLPTSLHTKLTSLANKQFDAEITLAPSRASLLDRNGKTLAMSVQSSSLFVIPKKLPESKQELSRFAQKMNFELRDLQRLKKANRSFAWLKRQLDTAQITALGDLEEWQDFLGVIQEPKRIYPEHELASHLLGYVGLDHNGLEGVEKILDPVLKGESIHARVGRDARGRPTLTYANDATKPALAAQPVTLSIDIIIQEIVETALKESVLKAKAKAGSAVVMDPNTGEILAMASYPTYDANSPTQDPERKRFRPIMDALELGSVVKPLFISDALSRGIIGPNETFFCENGKLKIPGGALHDDHPHGNATPGEIIKYSSNICTYKIVKRLGRQNFYDSLFRFGLTRNPGTGLPGEWAGRVTPFESWKEMRFANMAFGQGLAISPLQLTKAISILTNGGTDPGTRIFKFNKETEPESIMVLRAISKDASYKATEMMSRVVEEEGGTGSRASIEGYTVAGKTGTAEKYMQSTHSYSERIASFTGVVPAESPILTITVVIDEPKVKPAYGGILAGPTFQQIGTKTLRYLNSSGRIALKPKRKLNLDALNSRSKPQN